MNPRYIIPMRDHYAVLEYGRVVGTIVQNPTIGWDWYPLDRTQPYHTGKQIHIAMDIALNPFVEPRVEVE